MKSPDEMTREELIDEINRTQGHKARTPMGKSEGRDVLPYAENPGGDTPAAGKPCPLQFGLDQNGRVMSFPEPYEGKMFLGEARGKIPFPKRGIQPVKKKGKNICRLSLENMQLIADRGRPKEALSEIAGELIKLLHITRVDSKLYYYKDIFWKPLDSRNKLWQVAYDFVPVYKSLSDGQWGEIYKIIKSRIDEYPVLELDDPAIHHMICFKNGVYDILLAKHQ